ncbi:MAG: protein kinase [Pirellulales bacterium]
MADHAPRLDSLFAAAMAISSPAERAAFLDRACGENLRLRTELEGLLKAAEQAKSFLEQPPSEVIAAVQTGSADRHRAASLEAGLAATFSEEAAVVLGGAGHSVLKALGQTLDIPRVMLRESQLEGSDPITRPKSPEMPQRDLDSRYRLDGEIARGGMGAILKGRDTDLGRDLAIKVLLDAHKDKPEVIQRFVEEAQIGGQLQHPGIAPVYELGQFKDKRPFFSMKLVKGQTFAKLLADRDSPAADRGKFLGIFEQVCQTMAYAHSRGVIHRDLKPANIMVGAFGEVQVMDWGLAKVLPAGGVADEQKSQQVAAGQSMIATLRSGVGGSSPGAFGSTGSQTQMGSVMGTLAYMPPEQALGEIALVDERADVFGLGAILCEILTGKPPYVADHAAQIYRMASRGQLADCLQRLEACGADTELIALARHCLELEPADRPRNAGVLVERVTAYLESVELRLRESEIARAAEAARAVESLKTAREQEAAARAERRARRMQLGLASVVLLAVLMGGLAAAWTAAYQAHLKNSAIKAENDAKKAKADEVLARRRAENEELRAKQETRRAEAEKLRSDRMSATLAFDRGIQACGDGQVAEGLQWMAESLRVNPPEDKPFADVIRTSISRWCSELIALRHLISLDQKVTAVNYSPDGKLVLVSYGGTVAWFDATTGVETGKRLTQPGSITSLALSADGQLLATGSLERELRIWDVATGEQRFPPIPQPSTVTALDFSRSGHQVAVATGIVYLDAPSFAAVYDTATGQPVGPPLEHPKSVTGIKFHLAESQVLTSCGDGLLRTWEIATGKTLLEPLRFPASLGQLAIHSQRHVAAVSAGDQVHLVFVPDNRVMGHPMKYPAGINHLAFHPHLALLATAGSDGSARVWHWDTDDILGVPLMHQNYVTGTAFSPDGLSLVTSSEDKHARVFDLPLQSMMGIPLDKTDRPLVLRDATRSLVSGRPRTCITGRIPERIPHWIWDYLSAAFSADGRYVVTGSMDNHAYVWDLATGKMVGKPLAHENWVRCVAFHPDSKRVLTGSHDMTARLWDALTGEPRSPPLLNKSEVSEVEFSTDGSRLIVKAGRIVQVWQTDTATLIGVPLVHRESVLTACLSHDGRTVATSLDGLHPLLQFWDVQTSRPLGPPVFALRSVSGMRFEEGDQTLLTCSDEGIARRWQLPAVPQEESAVLQLLPQLVTGQKFISGNVLTPLSATEHRELRNRLLATGPAGRPERTAEAIEFWHDAQAATNEVIYDGGSAFAHFDQLLLTRYNDWTLHARYAASLHRYGMEPRTSDEWKLARQFGSQAALLDWCSERALQKERVYFSGEAIWFHQKALEIDPDNVECCRALGHCLARLGRFPEAREQFTRAVTLAPGRADALRDLAMVQLALDDRVSYRATCQKLLDVARTTDDIDVAYMTALTCVLDADCLQDWSPVTELAARCSARYEGDRCLEIAALYRAGRYDERLIYREKSTQVRYTHNVWEWIFQGLLQVKAGHEEAGRTILREKIEMVNLMDNAYPHDNGSTIWSDWIYHVQCHVLVAEAKALLE